MLEALITSKTRIKLLLKFFLNSNNTGYLRSLEPEFGESTNAIRYELNKFSKAGLLLTEQDGNKKVYKANTGHSLYPVIHRLLIKYVGIDEILTKVVNKIGQLEKVYLVGDLAKGIESSLIELYFFGNNIDEKYLIKLLNKTENIINRKVNYLIFAIPQNNTNLPLAEPEDSLLLWKREPEQ